MALSKKSVERLGTLYAIMQGVPEHRVSLSIWRGENNWETDRDLLKRCGTKACAVGWACAYPPFKKLGLSYSRKHKSPVYKAPASKTKREGFVAVADFFDITLDQARQLFTSSSWIAKGNSLSNLDFVASASDKRRVLSRIRNLMLKEGAITQARSRQLTRVEAKL